MQRIGADKNPEKAEKYFEQKIAKEAKKKKEEQPLARLEFIALQHLFRMYQ
jgi:hypothetical protein